jgi:hypothetical protein
LEEAQKTIWKNYGNGSTCESTRINIRRKKNQKKFEFEHLKDQVYRRNQIKSILSNALRTRLNKKKEEEKGKNVVPI